jgi:hypothetical protein
MRASAEDVADVAGSGVWTSVHVSGLGGQFQDGSWGYLWSMERLGGS